MDELKYPIGNYESALFSEEALIARIAAIKELPVRMEYAVLNLDAHQLHTPYREGGWTVHQLVHHVADSHMNAYIRFKLGLTENNPVVKPYDEAAWAEMADTKNLPINISLTLLHGIHRRWEEVLNAIESEEWNRTVFHPDHKKKMTLWYLLGMYAWHGLHHEAHILRLRERMGW